MSTSSFGESSFPTPVVNNVFDSSQTMIDQEGKAETEKYILNDSVALDRIDILFQDQINELANKQSSIVIEEMRVSMTGKIKQTMREYVSKENDIRKRLDSHVESYNIALALFQDEAAALRESKKLTIKKQNKINSLISGNKKLADVIQEHERDIRLLEDMLLTKGDLFNKEISTMKDTTMESIRAYSEKCADVLVLSTQIDDLKALNQTELWKNKEEINIFKNDLDTLNGLQEDARNDIANITRDNRLMLNFSIFASSRDF